MSAAGTSLTTGLGPAAVIIGGVTLAVAGLTYAYQESIKPIKEAEKAAKSFVDGIANWRDGVEQAKSALEGFNMETVISSKKMNELEEGIRKAQENIVAIAERAAAESRAYTEEERKQIEELIGLIADYTAKRLKHTRSKLKSWLLWLRWKEMCPCSCPRINQGAEEARAQTLAIAQARYTEQVAEAEKLYGHLGELDKRHTMRW